MLYRTEILITLKKISLFQKDDMTILILQIKRNSKHIESVLKGKI